MCDEPEPFWFVPQILEQTPKCTNHQQFLSKEEIPQEVKNKINKNYGASADILWGKYNRFTLYENQYTLLISVCTHFMRSVHTL